ncbi:hypothetical protein [Nocardioides stalactiti]|uniref:hypothetical protein n=1 Tax=Nocardioides stalactiti TaxID=2755356 RepID=UPI0015FFFDF1|nr:hypothetical protein [Nocardioides stalactiti]
MTEHENAPRDADDVPDDGQHEDPGTADDDTSDPARSDDEGHDWTTEGGATPRGPATDESAASGQ